MINSMKILYFVNGLNYKGGIARIVVDKANYLADKFKHDVTICVANNIVESAYPLSHNVKICRFDSENRLDTGLLKKISSVLIYYKKLLKLLDKEQPDIIVNAQTQIITWILPFVCKKIPKIMEIHFSYIGMKHNIEDKNRLFQKMYFIFNKLPAVFIYCGNKQIHQCLDFILGSIPVFGRKRVEGKELDSGFPRGVHHFADSIGAFLMPENARFAALLSPPSVAVHNNRHMRRRIFYKNVGFGSHES